MKLTRFLLCFIASALLLPAPMAVHAQDGDPQDGGQMAVEQEEQEKAASYAADIDTDKLAGWPQGPKVYADSAVVMDMESGAILFGKNMDARHYPASITKLLTVLVALENANLSDTIKFTEDSISFLQPDDAQIGMKAGEELSLEDSLYAILLASANEVSHAVAESVGANRLGGNYDTFIQKMNDRAKELGCTDSHWINPNGLHDDQHYTTAHDMALIASAVYGQEEFRKIMGTLEYKIGPTNLTKDTRVFQQNHKMLWPENYYYYQYCTGGKTGYTDQAKTTLVTMADNGKMQLAAVTLHDYGVDSYTDTKAMMDYVFDNFKKVPVKDLEKSKDIKKFRDPDPYVVLPEGVKFPDLTKDIVLTGKDMRGAKIIYTYKGQNVGSAEVTLTEDGYQKLAGVAAPSGSQKVQNRKENISKESSELRKEDRDDRQKSNLKRCTAIGAAVVFVLLLSVGAIKHKRKKDHKKHCPGHRR